MANKRIDQLPINSNALKDTDLIPIWDVINNKTEKVSLNTLSNFIVGVSGDTYVESGIYVSSASTINLYRNDDVIISISGITTSSTFTGNTEATCISELWVSTISGCSPVTIGEMIVEGNFKQGSNNITGAIYSSTFGGVNGEGLITPTSATTHSSHAQGYGTLSSGVASHAEGVRTISSKLGSHAEGIDTTAKGSGSHAEGNRTTASGSHSHTEGGDTLASGRYSHAEGYGNISTGIASHTEGGLSSFPQPIPYNDATSATTFSSHAEGIGTLASGLASHAEGENTIASGAGSHAEGYYTKAIGIHSHAECDFTTASGDYSHAEGEGTTASGTYSHAEGSFAMASGLNSHAEGDSASGSHSHAEGHLTIASGANSHSGGRGLDAVSNKIIASGETSFVHFRQTSASGTIGAYGNYSAILGGTDHNIGGGSTSSGIFAGSGNTISDNILRSVVLGGSHISGTTNDTVYVPNLDLCEFGGTLYTSSISGCSPVYIGPQIITPKITISGGTSATTITPTGINTPSLNVGGVPYSASCQTLFIKKSLVPAQISVLTATSVTVEMIPAPGVGKAIQIIAANARKIYGTTPYNNGVELILKYSGTSCSAGGFPPPAPELCRWGHTSGLMGSAYNTDTYGTFTQEAAYQNSWSPNDSVVLIASTNPGINGDSSLDIYITYKIITL